jgi:hypothetical protein
MEEYNNEGKSEPLPNKANNFIKANQTTQLENNSHA